jgi:hypothetical protein
MLALGGLAGDRFVLLPGAQAEMQVSLREVRAAKARLASGTVKWYHSKRRQPCPSLPPTRASNSSR